MISIRKQTTNFYKYRKFVLQPDAACPPLQTQEPTEILPNAGNQQFQNSKETGR